MAPISTPTWQDGGRSDNANGGMLQTCRAAPSFTGGPVGTFLLGGKRVLRRLPVLLPRETQVNRPLCDGLVVAATSFSPLEISEAYDKIAL